MVIKQKSLSLPRNVKKINSALNKTKPPILFLLDASEVLSCASDKAKLYTENFSENFNLDDSRISLPAFLLELT